ncbi:MAG: pyridoxamine 5'-phosphate oxidase family protein [Bacillota bacterium]
MHRMRRSDRAMTESAAWQFLQEQQVGRLGLISDEEPYIVPLNYVVLDNSIYFHSAREGRKMEALQQSSRVCFLVDQLISISSAQRACDFAAFYRSVMVRGTAHLIEDADRKMQILNALTRKYAQDQAFAPAAAEAVMPTAVVQIRVDSITGKEKLPD